MPLSRDESKERNANPTFRTTDRLDRRVRSSYMYFDAATSASSVGEEVFYVTADYLHRYRKLKQRRGILHQGIIFAFNRQIAVLSAYARIDHASGSVAKSSPPAVFSHARSTYTGPFFPAPRDKILIVGLNPA